MKRLFLALATLVTCSAAAQRAPDLALVNGRIFTSDPAKPWAEALAIADNTISAVGDNESIRQLAGRGTKQIDLRGNLVIPGLNDAHTQQTPMPEGFRLTMTPESSAEDVGLAVISAADESPATMWLIGTIGPRTLADHGLTAAALEKIAPGRNVMLMSSGGDGYAFSATALRTLKIREDAADPAGGWFERDTNGQITGKAFGYAGWNSARALADRVSDDEAVAALRDFAAQALRYGITSVQNVATFPSSRYEKIVRHADVTLRIRMVRFPRTEPSGYDRSDGRGLPARHPERRLSIVSGTRWNLDAARASSEAKGGTLPAGDISAMLAESVASNDQLLLNAAVQRTAGAVLDAMRANVGVDWKSRRVRFDDSDGLTPDLLPTAKALGVIVAENPARPGVRLKTVLRAGVPLALGSQDDLNPFVNILLATTPGHASEAITRQEAVEAYTRGSAFAEFAEDEKGTIAVGKLADLAVLSQDIFKVASTALLDTESILTIVDGKIVYDAGVLAVPGRRVPRQEW